MTYAGWLQIALVFALVIGSAAPLGVFMARVFSSTTQPNRLEWGIYALYGADATREHNWLGYLRSVLWFNAAGFVLLYGVLRLQYYLPLNPQGFAGMPPHLAFNTAISFITNTNWQSYGGESTLSNLSQMMGLTVQNFLSAATGIAVAVALTRAFAGDSISNPSSEFRNIINR
jgi:potassium-transporting ATPase potassium-binding subunit